MPREDRKGTLYLTLMDSVYVKKDSIVQMILDDGSGCLMFKIVFGNMQKGADRLKHGVYLCCDEGCMKLIGKENSNV